MNTTNKGGIPANVGFPNNMNKGHEVRRAITVQHTKEDEGATFVDNFGRSYVHTAHGNVY